MWAVLGHSPGTAVHIADGTSALGSGSCFCSNLLRAPGWSAVSMEAWVMRMKGHRIPFCNIWFQLECCWLWEEDPDNGLFSGQMKTRSFRMRIFGSATAAVNITAFSSTKKGFDFASYLCVPLVSEALLGQLTSILLPHSLLKPSWGHYQGHDSECFILQE